MKTIVHVNQAIIKSNRKHKTNHPVLTVKTYKSNDYAHEVVIDGPCKIVYSPDRPLSCGATVYVVTESNVKTITKKVGNTDVENFCPRKCTKRKCTKRAKKRPNNC